MKIVGGVSYPDSAYQFDTSKASQDISDALASAALAGTSRVLNAQTPEDMRWSFKAPINGVTTNINAIVRGVRLA